jgi:hypothetical protein
VLNTTFSNISAISWQPVLVVEEAGVPERTTDHGQETGKLHHLRLRVECTLFCMEQIQCSNVLSKQYTFLFLFFGLVKNNQSEVEKLSNCLTECQTQVWNILPSLRKGVFTRWQYELCTFEDDQGYF